MSEPHGTVQLREEIEHAIAGALEAAGGQDHVEELQCAICLRPALRPTKTPCGHPFHRHCLEGALRTERRCPICREVFPADNEKVFLSCRILNSIGGRVRVRCPQGCGAKEMRFDTLAAHVGAGGDCPRTPVRCKNEGCGQVSERRDAQRHLADCPHRLEPWDNHGAASTAAASGTVLAQDPVKMPPDPSGLRVALKDKLWCFHCGRPVPLRDGHQQCSMCWRQTFKMRLQKRDPLYQVTLVNSPAHLLLALRKCSQAYPSLERFAQQNADKSVSLLGYLLVDKEAKQLPIGAVLVALEDGSIVALPYEAVTASEDFLTALLSCPKTPPDVSIPTIVAPGSRLDYQMPPCPQPCTAPGDFFYYMVYLDGDDCDGLWLHFAANRTESRAYIFGQDEFETIDVYETWTEMQFSLNIASSPDTPAEPYFYFCSVVDTTALGGGGAGRWVYRGFEFSSKGPQCVILIPCLQAEGFPAGTSWKTVADHHWRRTRPNVIYALCKVRPNQTTEDPFVSDDDPQLDKDIQLTLQDNFAKGYTWAASCRACKMVPPKPYRQFHPARCHPWKVADLSSPTGFVTYQLRQTKLMPPINPKVRLFFKGGPENQLFKSYITELHVHYADIGPCFILKRLSVHPVIFHVQDTCTDGIHHKDTCPTRIWKWLKDAELRGAFIMTEHDLPSFQQLVTEERPMPATEKPPQQGHPAAGGPAYQGQYAYPSAPQPPVGTAGPAAYPQGQYAHAPAPQPPVGTAGPAAYPQHGPPPGWPTQ